MTLASTTVQNAYTGNGASYIFPFTFPLFETADVTVQVTSPGGIVYNLSLTQDFTLSLNPTGADQYLGGTLSLVNNSQAWLTGGFLTSGWVINIMRIMALTQNTSIRNQGSYYPETIEDTFDYLTMICQQINAGLGTTGGSGGTPSIVYLNDLVNGHIYQVVASGGVLGLELVS